MPYPFRKRVSERFAEPPATLPPDEEVEELLPGEGAVDQLDAGSASVERPGGGAMDVPSSPGMAEGDAPGAEAIRAEGEARLMRLRSKGPPGQDIELGKETPAEASLSDIRRTAARKIMFDYSSPQRWGGAGGYTYEFIPGADGTKESGTIKVTSAKGEEAYASSEKDELSKTDPYEAILSEWARGEAVPTDSVKTPQAAPGSSYVDGGIEGPKEWLRRYYDRDEPGLGESQQPTDSLGESPTDSLGESQQPDLGESPEATGESPEATGESRLPTRWGRARRRQPEAPGESQQPPDLGESQQPDLGESQQPDFGESQPPDFGESQPPPDFGESQPPDFGESQQPDLGESPSQFGESQPPDFGESQQPDLGESPSQFGESPSQFGEPPYPANKGAAKAALKALLASHFARRYGKREPDLGESQQPDLGESQQPPDLGESQQPDLGESQQPDLGESQVANLGESPQFGEPPYPAPEGATKEALKALAASHFARRYGKREPVEAAPKAKVVPKIVPPTPPTLYTPPAEEVPNSWIDEGLYTRVNEKLQLAALEDAEKLPEMQEAGLQAKTIGEEIPAMLFGPWTTPYKSRKEKGKLVYGPDYKNLRVLVEALPKNSQLKAAILEALPAITTLVENMGDTAARPTSIVEDFPSQEEARSGIRVEPGDR